MKSSTQEPSRGQCQSHRSILVPQYITDNQKTIYRAPQAMQSLLLVLALSSHPPNQMASVSVTGPGSLSITHLLAYRVCKRMIQILLPSVAKIAISSYHLLLVMGIQQILHTLL